MLTLTSPFPNCRWSNISKGSEGGILCPCVHILMLNFDKQGCWRKAEVSRDERGDKWLTGQLFLCWRSLHTITFEVLKTDVIIVLHILYMSLCLFVNSVNYEYFFVLWVIEPKFCWCSTSFSVTRQMHISGAVQFWCIVHCTAYDLCRLLSFLRN